MPSSLPALVAGILQSNQAWRIRSAAEYIEKAPIVPAYLIDGELPLDELPGRAVQVVHELVQKLSRLGDAYGNWPLFEAAPYFDLYPAHMRDFCRVEETSHVVRVRLYADLLLPVFRAAERFWVHSFLPAYHAGVGNIQDAFWHHFVHETTPRMVTLLNDAQRAIQKTLNLLTDEIDVLGALGGLEERIQHRPSPCFQLAPGMAQALQRLPREMPTLTLDVIYRRPSKIAPGRSVWLESITGQAQHS
ncbi:MAG: hypothetical protein U9R25_13685 [Chloroflexota bacterium]|nr:hypothetical protein [Chloroflexota bacterium]